MPHTDNKDELDSRISILRDNLRQLVEQGASQSGAADESRVADRIAENEKQLEPLLKKRETLGD